MIGVLVLLGGAPAAALETALSCSNPPLSVEYTIPFYSGTVLCGNLLLESDIGGTHPWIPPKVTLPEAKDDALYTLMYIDPYVDVPNNGSWPTCGSSCVGSKAPARHWLVGNIPGKDLQVGGSLSDATTVSKFKGPSPPWGSHPYGQFLYEQPSKQPIDFPTLPSPTGIYNWDVVGFVSKYGLGHPVATNWHVTQHADPRPTVM
jgi:hypothetical protein